MIGARLAAVGLAALVAIGCAARRGEGARARPGVGEARSYVYADDAGLRVITAEAAVAQPVAKRVDVDGHFVVDHLTIEPVNRTITVIDPSQPSGHSHEVVSGASARIAGDTGTEKVRVEAGLGVTGAADIGDAPAELGGRARVSVEPDYLSFSGSFHGRVELLERNLTLSAFAGYGHDTVTPEEPPPGEDDVWPATHQRVNVGGTLSQILGRRVIASGGVALTHQFGVLASPYRRALVRTTLFPEAVPDERTRVTTFLDAAFYMAAGTSLTLRAGVYVDTWGVVAFIPEITLAKSVGEAFLFTARYRLYDQTPATFYARKHDGIEPEMSSDLRLGRTIEHAPNVALRWTVAGERGGFGSLTFDASYGLSVLDFVGAPLGITLGHVVGLGALFSY